MRYGAVVLPQPDEPEQASVGVSIEASAGTGTDRRSGDGPRRPSALRGGRAREGVGSERVRSALGRCAWHPSFPELNRPSRGSRSERSGVRGTLLRGSGTVPPRTRPAAGAPQGWGERAPAFGREKSSGTARHSVLRAPDDSGRASARGGRPRKTPRPSGRRRHWAVRVGSGSRVRRPRVRPRGSGGVRLGGLDGAHRGPTESVHRPGGRTRSEAEGATRDAMGDRGARASRDHIRSRVAEQ